MKTTRYAKKAFIQAHEIAKQMRHDLVTPEHLLMAILSQPPMWEAMKSCMLSCNHLLYQIQEFLDKQEKVPSDVDAFMIKVSNQFQKLSEKAEEQIINSGKDAVDVPHLLNSYLLLEESYARYYLVNMVGDKWQELLASVVTQYEKHNRSEDSADWTDMTELTSHLKAVFKVIEDSMGSYSEEDYDEEDYNEDCDNQPWKQYVTCMNDHVHEHNPLIGREEELERTIQVLCRMEKNNPLHLGDPGVGKTALVWGLVARIESGKVPQKLKGYQVYMLDLGSLLAGTQFRGEFEKRVKLIMEGIRQEKKGIVYIDEIHNLVGAGSTSDSSLDAGNMLKPYLEGREIRFIGSTTHEEYNRYLSKSHGLTRRFQTIDITEPSIEECIRIIQKLKNRYEQFHGVKYTKDAIRYAVEKSAQFVNDRFLPDKAIDLVDEAGAYRQLHPEGGLKVDRALISQVLSKVCKVDTLALNEPQDEALETLEPQMKSLIYGQDEAIRQVVEAVQLSRAGLTEEEKPIASLLFVGPTGVGKTEVARVLAKNLGISLVRFDMSEYTEKHTVAKLIGSPAGYVGYEDGGLLTDAIRKTPNCVLLLDEIEKAHSDIYSVLLQVMDYARLTDNKGRKADFRHVILIMTSNAGAQYAHQAGVGFNSSITTGEAMLRQVKKVFKPEFLNRLSGTVVFHDMDEHMASLILDKKLFQLQNRLSRKKVTLQLSPEARLHLLHKGFTREYGAREIDRVLQQQLTPLLMREILFGKLKRGGVAQVSLSEGKLEIQSFKS